MERVMLACLHTIKAGDASTIIYLVVLIVNTGCLALSCTETARFTLVRIYLDLEKRVTGEETQHRTDVS